MWGGRFSGALDDRMRLFNDSFPIDRRLWAEDIRGSVAWANGLARAGILTAAECAELQPALSLRARVSFVRRVPPGEGVSYGHRLVLDRETTIATLPLGYADGVPRRLGEVGGDVLVGGKRRPIAGTVTMDQLMVDCGDEDVAPGDEAVLIGAQGEEEITATEWAERTGTIAYEIVTGLSARLPRRYEGEEPEPA